MPNMISRGSNTLWTKGKNRQVSLYSIQPLSAEKVEEEGMVLGGESGPGINLYNEGLVYTFGVGLWLIRGREKPTNRQTASQLSLWNCNINWCNEVQFSRANSENKEGHLKRAHSITKHGKKTPTMPVNKDAAREVIARAEKEGYANLVSVLKVDSFKEALIAWIVICQLSISVAVNELFIKFLELLYPSIRTVLPSASNTIRSWIMASFTFQKCRIKEKLHKVSSLIHFSFDLWTLPNHLALMGVVAHYIDESGRNQSVSNTPPLPRT